MMGEKSNSPNTGSKAKKIIRWEKHKKAPAPRVMVLVQQPHALPMPYVVLNSYATRR